MLSIILLTLGLLSSVTCIALLFTFVHQNKNTSNLLGEFTSRFTATTEQNQEQTKALQTLTIRLEERERFNQELKANLAQILKTQHDEQAEFRTRFSEQQLNNLKIITDSLQKGMLDVRSQVLEMLKTNTHNLELRLNKLTDDTNLRLKEINNRVEQRLSEGFEKTTATFTDVVKRLALIDEAQKKITELSVNVVSLQEILSDKRSRGAFGEVQLSALLRNVLPENHFSLQHTLSNGKRADCILFLPDPTGNIVIDAKFPLESFQRLSNANLTENERQEARQQFRSDIRKHIQDIAGKYILEGETSDGALMFIPAEAIFAEIHANYMDLVEFSHRSHVWMTSPTTMMAILTTARAALKDAATRQQAHLIRQHLTLLAKDFERFQKRMENLAKHVNLAHTDVEEVYQASKKITNKFSKIEKVELGLELAIEAEPVKIEIQTDTM
ncbi:MAG: DNA recombination protein RmuC [Gammaproteobacteria bacterium]